MATEQLPWRSFDDQGVVDSRWNSSMTPTYYIIDPMGTIRRKWVGKPAEKALNAALTLLIQEAEDAASAR